MATEYSDFETLNKDYPEATLLVIRENEMQCPEAKFVRAVVGFCDPEDNPEDAALDMMILFDCGTPEQLLWVWVVGVDDPYIDEYYEMSAQDASEQLNSMV